MAAEVDTHHVENRLRIGSRLCGICRGEPTRLCNICNKTGRWDQMMVTVSHMYEYLVAPRNKGSRLKGGKLPSSYYDAMAVFLGIASEECAAGWLLTENTQADLADAIELFISNPGSDL